MHVATPPAPCPPPTAHLALPFFDAAHRTLALGLLPWAAAQQVDETDDRAACRDWVRRLGAGGWLRYCVPAAHGGALPALDSRALVLLRETLAYHSPLADFACAMQGLGSGAITLAGNPAQQARYLPGVASGRLIAAFALSEPEAGSDVAAMQTMARSAEETNPGDRPDSYSLAGSKTWISNGGLADFYCVFAKTDPTAGTRGISAFIVDADTPGLDATQHLHVMAPHPLATLRFADCRLPASALLGPLHGGFKLALRTLDIFRASVAAAALGMARRALAEAVQHARQRRMFGQTLADFQLTQARLGEMAALVDSAALLTYRAAWLRDEGEKHQRSVAAELRERSVAAAMAKMTATENAQRVIDMALQLHGGRGVERGSKVEALYRDIRALRIYEGATEVQQLIIGKAVLQP
ncbi:acyl-CoA dehydrogenase family protein [Verminephrobacter eiseniae]|uniref:Acyl-CoA dehydrogenase domain protein n=2 Tax=Verminephrobacter eiseniae TaxID=364317 RepID=A1WF73_VEREI|nr:acyl-CoA dehydrogenase family protein [Verminephrobacter eiseniae]ABM56280.1 acyl-CoA dehydrogenase domain protein [Verminephrobacter eiseniae EF01-2]MCW5286644.1 acyl-CoA dehydrogenase [Verminephrobacter eiseniae]MCW5304942.1 acyl-CoA dehydrogenase [Verminephrobacter eiseniae]